MRWHDVTRHEYKIVGIETTHINEERINLERKNGESLTLRKKWKHVERNNA